MMRATEGPEARSTCALDPDIRIMTWRVRFPARGRGQP